MGYTSITFDGTADEIREQWLESRRHRIGGSDAAAILGLSNYDTPYTKWLEKTGRVEAPDLSDNEKVHWGTVLEPVVADEFARRHPEFDVMDPGAVYISSEHPFMLASVDRMLSSREGAQTAVLEIKTCGERRRSDWDDGVPPYYLAQVNHYLAVTGLTMAYVAVLIGGQEYREYIVERDDDDINYLIAKEREFWQMVEDDQMPPFTGSDVDNRALMEQFPGHNGEFVQSVDMDESISSLKALKNEIKDMQKEAKRIESELRAEIGSNKGIETPRYRCTWVRANYNSFDSKRFAADHPDLFDEYTVTGDRDMGLRISERK